MEGGAFNMEWTKFKTKKKEKKSTDNSENYIFENVPIVCNSALYFPDYYDDMHSFHTFVSYIFMVLSHFVWPLLRPKSMRRIQLELVS